MIPYSESAGDVKGGHRHHEVSGLTLIRVFSAAFRKTGSGTYQRQPGGIRVFVLERAVSAVALGRTLEKKLSLSLFGS